MILWNGSWYVKDEWVVRFNYLTINYLCFKCEKLQSHHQNFCMFGYFLIQVVNSHVVGPQIGHQVKMGSTNTAVVTVKTRKQGKPVRPVTQASLLHPTTRIGFHHSRCWMTFSSSVWCPVQTGHAAASILQAVGFSFIMWQQIIASNNRTALL